MCAYLHRVYGCLLFAGLTLFQEAVHAQSKDTSHVSIDSSQVQLKPEEKQNSALNSSKISEKIDSLKHLVQLDSTAKRKIKRKFIPNTSGTISAGYDYGIIPFAANIQYPQGYYSSQGSVGVSALGIPLTATYYYSSLKNVAGLNNYFRLSFDDARYKESIQNASIKKLEEEKQKLSSYLNLQQLMQQKLAYYELMAKDLPNQTVLNAKMQEYKNKLIDPSQSFNDSLKFPMTDSIKNPKINPQSIKIPSYADSIKILSNIQHSYDSTWQSLEKYKQEYQEIQKKVNAVKNKIAILENPQQAVQDNPYSRKMQSVLSGIKKIDVGLCYPNYSTFLVSGSTIKGVNIEWEKKLYFAFTYGKTINTILTTNNIIQNQLQTGRNLYNFFDFNNVKDSRKILAMKFGIGKKESSHFHVGFLMGTGLSSYLNTFGPLNTEKNIVIELDGKIALNKSNSIDLVYGKSAMFQSGLNISPGENPSHNLFSGFRSNAALVRYNSDINRTKTKITLTGRLVDPYFKSYGVGFIRSDNLRYEFKVEQAIGNKMKFTGFYRRDRDNLLDLMLATSNLQTMGANLSVKINKRLSARASYSPVIQNISSKDSSSYNQHHLNNITNAVLTYVPRAGKINSFFNALYSYYQFSGKGGSTNSYQNFNLSNTTIFNPSFKTNVAANYFLNNASDSLNNSTSMASGDVTFSVKNGGMVTLGLKYAYNKIMQNQTGALLKVNLPIISHFQAELMAEKLVLGDFYNNYNILEIKKFPFYGYVKIILNW